MKAIQRIYKYLETNNIKPSVFEKEIQVSNGYLSKMKDREGNLGEDVILKITEKFDISLNWLLTGNGPINANTPVESARKNSVSQDIKHKAYLENEVFDRKIDQTLTKPNKKETKNSPIILGLPKVITVDSAGHENIVHVPIKARAGYLLGFGDPVYVESLPTYNLPGLRNGTFRSFEVEGVSMKPTIGEKDWVVGQWVEKLSDIRENRVHVIVTHNRGILIKRVLNRLESRGKLYLKSDTVYHREDHPTIELDPEDVAEIWYSRIKFSPDFSEPSEFYRTIDDMRLDIMELKKKIASP